MLFLLDEVYSTVVRIGSTPEIKLNSSESVFQAEEFASDDDPSSRALPETEALWYLSVASKEHRALLKHPVIASFLWLKWQRIRDITQ